MAVYPVTALAAFTQTEGARFGAWKAGDDARLPPAIAFPELQEAVGFPAYWDAEKKYAAE
ncbi:hypothetical protein WDZ92_47275 [Nostoc sp. NIES-2111]